jgi:hypothetical protein
MKKPIEMTEHSRNNGKRKSRPKAHKGITNENGRKKEVVGRCVHAKSISKRQQRGDKRDNGTSSETDRFGVIDYWNKDLFYNAIP